MFKILLIILLVLIIVFGVYSQYTRDNTGEYLTFHVKTYDINVLSSDYKEYSGKMFGVYFCSRNDKPEDGTNKLMKFERYIFIKKIDAQTYEGKIFRNYLKDSNKEYYIICPASYDISYIDPTTEAFIDFSERGNTPLTIYWAYPPPPPLPETNY